MFHVVTVLCILLFEIIPNRSATFHVNFCSFLSEAEASTIKHRQDNLLSPRSETQGASSFLQLKNITLPCFRALFLLCELMLC